MCRQTDAWLLGPAEVHHIVRRAARYVAARTGLEAEDLGQEAYLGLPKLSAEWSEELQLAPARFLRRRIVCYLYDVAKPALRRRRFHGEIAEDAVVPNGGGSWANGEGTAAGAGAAAGGFSGAEQRVLAGELLGRLSERERRVMRLRFWAGADNGEIAAELGVSVGTVEKDVASAMARMRKFVGERRFGGSAMGRIGPAFAVARP
jgi:RNA polymerase sigma factor (sigma-70 family)